jgi:hypothetical protein
MPIQNMSALMLTIDNFEVDAAVFDHIVQNIDPTRHFFRSHCLRSGVFGASRSLMTVHSPSG